MIREADDTEGPMLCGLEGGRAARAFQLWECEGMVDEACQVERGHISRQHLRTRHTPLRGSSVGHMIVRFAKEAVWEKSTLAV